MPIGLQGLLPLPEGAPEPATGRLPWPEGSLLSGTLEPATEPGQAVLQIGAYRFLAHVPRNIPHQAIWLQLIDRNIPASFRLLTAEQAEAAVAHMLERQVSQGEAGTTRPTAHTQQPAPPTHGDLPYTLVPVSPQPPRWLITDPEDEGQPRGMLRAEATAQGFQLRGRMDLPNLGPVAFSIADAPAGMRLSLHAAQNEAYQALQRDLPAWLAGQDDGLDASLHAGVPGDEDMGGARMA